MANKKWIQGAIKHEGALRKTAKKQHLIKGDEKLSMADLKKLEQEGGKTAKRAHLAETLRKFYNGGEPHEDDNTTLVFIEREELEEESEEPYEDEYAAGGKVKEKVFIEYLNKDKGYKMDRKYFNSYEEAERWARMNFDKFDTDYIRYEYEDGGKMKEWKGNLYVKQTSVDYFGDHTGTSKSPTKRWFRINRNPMTKERLQVMAKPYIEKFGKENVKMKNFEMLAEGGEIEWGEDLGDGFSVGNDVYITDSKSMFKGKTGFVTGLVGKDLLVTISENGNDRSVVVSKNGVEILDAPEFAKGGSVKKVYKSHRMNFPEPEESQEYYASMQYGADGGMMAKKIKIPLYYNGLNGKVKISEIESRIIKNAINRAKESNIDVKIYFSKKQKVFYFTTSNPESDEDLLAADVSTSGEVIQYGGNVKIVKVGDRTFYLTYIDNTHYYVSLSPEILGKVYNIKPFYQEKHSWLNEEVINWLSDISQHKGELIDDNKMAGGGMMAKGGMTFKREKFKSTPIQEGEVFFDTPNMRSGYYNQRVIKKIDGKKTLIAVADVFNGRVEVKSSPYEVPTAYVQKVVDENKKQRFEKEQDKKQRVFNLSKKIGANKAMGGNLLNLNVRNELYKILDNLAKAEPNVSDSSVGAAPNSMSFRASQSGTAISIETNNFFRGGYYSVDKPYLLLVKVGGALPYERESVIIDTLKDLLSKYYYTTSLGTSTIDDTSGTNWSAVMIVAPSNMTQWSPLKSLDSFTNIRSMADGGMMAKGGEVTFDDKVKAISKKLEGKSVPAQYRKEYGSKYDKEEANEAARRIVGNMRKLYGE